MSKNEEISSLIKIFATIWSNQLYLEYKFRDKNVSNAFKGVGAFGEIISTFYKNNYIGSGSGGLGFDLINRQNKKEIEVKTSVTFQSNKCLNCNFKFSKLFSECTVCGSKKFKEVEDSRFGINAKTLLNAYKSKLIDCLFVYHIFDIKEDFNNEQGIAKFKINCYIIQFTYDDSFEENKKIQYFKNQYELSSKSNRCNLLPLSYDFWLLTPRFFDSWEITINFKNPSFNPVVKNIWNEKLEKIKVNLDVCKSKIEKKFFLKISGGKHFLYLSDFVKNFNYRKKNFNKNRGKILNILEEK